MGCVGMQNAPLSAVSDIFNAAAASSTAGSKQGILARMYTGGRAKQVVTDAFVEALSQQSRDIVLGAHHPYNAAHDHVAKHAHQMAGLLLMPWMIRT